MIKEVQDQAQQGREFDVNFMTSVFLSLLNLRDRCTI